MLSSLLLLTIKLGNYGGEEIMQLAGKVALITGAGSGIGKAAALLLAKEGAKIVALGRTEDELEETVTKIQNSGGESIPVAADISQPGEMQQAIQKIVNQWGRLDIVFANAGINGVWAPIEELEPEEWNKTINVNLTGTFLTVKYASTNNLCPTLPLLEPG
jgi:NAD(P)-dependent dehydrogenase (short-subunit alcohol dehydrogenase family)